MMAGEAVPNSDFIRERLRALQREMLVGIASGESLLNVMTSLCYGVESLAPEVICSILTVDSQNRLGFLAGPSLPEVYSRSTNGISVGPDVGSCGTAIYRKQPVEVVDIETDPLWANYKTLAFAVWAQSLLVKSDRGAGRTCPRRVRLLLPKFARGTRSRTSDRQGVREHLRDGHREFGGARETQ